MRKPARYLNRTPINITLHGKRVARRLRLLPHRDAHCTAAADGHCGVAEDVILVVFLAPEAPPILQSEQVPVPLPCVLKQQLGEPPK